MAYVLIGGTAVGTVLTLAFLPALYAIWFCVSSVDAVRRNLRRGGSEMRWYAGRANYKRSYEANFRLVAVMRRNGHFTLSVPLASFNAVESVACLQWVTGTSAVSHLT
jgi:hypothetical protein